MIGLAALLASCGGGATDSGGGDGGDDGGGGGGDGPGYQGDKDTYPVLEEDPDYLGDKIDYDGTTFTVNTEDGHRLKFSPTGKKGSVYQFKSTYKSGGARFSPMAMANKDAIIMGAYVHNAESFGESEIFGIDGHWATNLPERIRYTGTYQSMNSSGQKNPDTPILIDLNLEAIHTSSGYDLGGGETVVINFTGSEGATLYGTISDHNGYNHPSNFGLFGKNGDTIAGGYTSELGVGILLGDTR